MLHMMILCLLLCGCAGEKKDMNNQDTVRLMVTSDLHYLSKELYDPQSPMFQLLMSKNDGKLVEEGALILETLKQKAIEEKPDVLLLCGDITFNGELISLKEVSSVLKEIEDAGIPVLVTTGNHDIFYRSCMTYFGDVPGVTEDISDTAFAEVMGEYGYDEALYRDENSLSYIYALNESLWFLVLDANQVTSPCSIGGETLVWMDEKLAEAEEKGIQVITMCHQNILIQSEMMYQGYVLYNHETVEKILKSHGVYLCLSGHSHLQHTSVSDGLTDICNESIAVYPLQYGMIDVNPGQRTFNHELKTLGILNEESFDMFSKTVLRMVTAQVEENVEDPAVREKMIDYALRMNAAYFSGNREEMENLSQAEELSLWETYCGDSFWGMYLKNIISELEKS